MKLTLLLIPLLLLSSCTIDWNDEKDARITNLSHQIQDLENTVTSYEKERSDIFISKSLGVSFESFYWSGIFSISSQWGSPTKIQYIYKNASAYYYPIIDPIEVFYKKNRTQTPEERIMEIVKETWNNPDNCTVLPRWIDGLWFDSFIIDLKEKNIKYTFSEKQELERAKKDSEENGWHTFYFTEAEIYNDRLLKECGKYAVWKPPAMSPTSWSYFLSSSGTITMLYHPSSADPGFIKWGTLQLFDPISE